jgi:glycosyltransferase involved in cell wall biosynthesis
MSELSVVGGRLSVAWHSPLPPARTGVAHYSSLILPELSKRVDLTTDNRQLTTNIYHLGNNPFHESIYRAALERPGIVVLHDVVLHHLIVEMTLARGDVEGYVAALRASHGEPGAAWARARAAGMHMEMANFLLPASIDVARRSRAVVVHNRWAAERLLSFGVETPVHVVPHPYVHEEPRVRVDVPRGRIVGLFGFLTSAKRADVVLQAFARARRRDRELVLLVVGEPAPNIDVSAMRAEGVVFTGYVPDETFASYYAAADRLVNLRYPSAGETSGTLIRALDAGKPVAVSDYAQFAEYPDDIVTKIPLGDGEVEALTEFLLHDHEVAAAQRAYLEAHNTLAHTVAAYEAVLRGDAPRVSAPHASRELALLPSLAVVAADATSVTLRNSGDFTIRTRLYGQPAYRVIANGRWFELPRDLAPGESARLELPGLSGLVRLQHALQSVPMIDPEPFAEVRLAAL